MNNRQKVIYLAAVFALIIVGVVIWLLGVSTKSNSDSQNTTQTTKTGVTISVAPTGSTLTVNGQEVDEGPIELKPGTYKIVASNKGFASQTQTVTINNSDHYKIGFALTSNSDATAHYYEFDSAEAGKAEAIMGQKSEAAGVSRANKLPLIKKLPKIEKGRYKITYGTSLAKPDESSAVAIYIDYVDDTAKASAVNWIKYQGYDPATLEIIYRTVKTI